MAGLAGVMHNGWRPWMGHRDCYVQDSPRARHKQPSRRQIHPLKKPQPEQTCHQLKMELYPQTSVPLVMIQMGRMPWRCQDMEPA